MVGSMRQDFCASVLDGEANDVSLGGDDQIGRS